MIKKGLENQRKNLQEIELITEKKQKELTELKNLKRAKGITLIALIITIIILIILAGITLVALSGENGVLNKASSEDLSIIQAAKILHVLPDSVLDDVLDPKHLINREAVESMLKRHTAILK